MSQRKIKTAKDLLHRWEDYKQDCDNQMVMTHNFDSKAGDYVSKPLQHKTTYTVEGFCAFLGISRASFYANYAQNDAFSDAVTLIRELCEVDARRKFELGVIPSNLAGLWMSNYGYTKQPAARADDAEINSGIVLMPEVEDDD